MAITVGINIGQRQEPSALCVAETQTRGANDRSAVHHLVRHLSRLPISTSFPDIARRAAQVSSAIESRAGDSPRIYVDATGLGQPVVDLFEEAVSGARIVTPVFFTHGDRRIETGSGWRSEVQLGKAHLVCRLQTLLQTARLHLPRTPEAEILARELMEYEIRDSRKSRMMRTHQMRSIGGDGHRKMMPSVAYDTSRRANNRAEVSLRSS